MNDQELERLREILATALESEPLLDAWEKGFINDINQRLTAWGNEMRVSPKMWSILHRILEKCS